MDELIENIVEKVGELIQILIYLTLVGSICLVLIGLFLLIVI